MLFGARTSLFVGLLGLSIGFALGLLFGGLSGYYGGGIDTAVQRLTEFLQSLPTLPLWMALAALVPKDWTPVQVYFGISTVLAIIGWTSLARVIRGKLLSLREEDYVTAAKISGVGEWAHRHPPPPAGLCELPHRASDPRHPADDSRRGRR